MSSRYKWLLLAMLSLAFFFHQADRVLFGLLTIPLSPLMVGALSDRMGLRGFEIGFGILGGSYLIGALAMLSALLFTFKRDRITNC